MKLTKDRFSKIKKIGFEADFFQDFYHQTLIMPWVHFFILYAVLFFAFNLFFGFLFWIDTSAVSGTEGSFFKSFSFSVQTFSTIGYGVFAPTNLYSHTLVILESLLGVLFTALLTGLTFSKFSKPKSRILFTDKVIITTFNHQKTLMFRMANLRGNQIAEASVKAVLLVSQISPEGHHMRIQKDIHFVRSTSSFFILSWTVMHLIDEKSPLFNLTAKDISEQKIEMSVSVIGHDETFSQSVHRSGIYTSNDFIFDSNFEDMLTVANGETIAIDFSKFNALKP